MRTNNVRHTANGLKATTLLAAAVAATAVGTRAHADSTITGTPVAPVTISLSGSTAMKNFTKSEGFTYLTPGTSITLSTGAGGSDVTYAAPTGGLVRYQLAQSDLSLPASEADPVFNVPALRIEWHEQGSVEGVLELANDQIGMINSVAISNRSPSTGNPVWVNRASYNAPNPSVIGAGTFGTPTGQAPVQMAISDVNARQGFAIGGNAAWNRTPGQAGYGMGNQALSIAAGSNIQGLGAVSVCHQLYDSTILNMPSGTANPAGGTYAAGPWNTGGLDNLQNTAVAQTATLFVANPGTGLEHVNRTDAQWLQATGRLRNGADFNVATRDVNSGTLNVAANNVGLDPSFAVGENDGGNGTAADGGTTQVDIGPGVTFTNKTSGGSQLRPVVQNSRMGFGHLSLSDAIGSVRGTGGSRPIRALDYRDDADDVSNNSNGSSHQNWVDNGSGTISVVNGDLPSGQFVRASARSITAGSYVIYQNETYVTVKAPNAAFAGDTAAQWAARTDAATGIKGDNAGHDVADVRSNILSAVYNFPASLSVSNPGDALLSTSFILPQFMAVRKTQDGVNQSVNNAASAGGSLNAAFREEFINLSSTPTAFNPDAPSSITSGSSSFYGNRGGTGGILITANNFLFGDFDQRAASSGVSGKGVRDFSDLAVAQQAQAALAASGMGASIFTSTATYPYPLNANNNTAVAGLPSQLGFAATKGDLIVLGDFDSDGDFDGKDLYLLARGAALADNTSSTILTGAFSDSLRNGVLRKNAALDQLAASATAQQKIDASANLASDPSGANAFNKRDVNRDGRLDLNDAFAVDKFFGKDYRNLDEQVVSTLNTDGTITPTGTQRSVSFVDMELTDDGVINAADITVVNQAIAGTGNESWSAARTKVGGGNIVVARTGGNVSVTPGASLDVAAGQFTVAGTRDVFTDTTTGDHVAVAASGTGVLQIAAGGPNVTVASLTVTGSGKVDVTNTPMAVDYVAGSSPIDSVRSYLASARNGGAWDGSGLTSSNAQADGQHLLAMAYVEASDLTSAHQVALLGHTADTSTLITNLTYYGDANDDGFLNADDFALIDRGFARGMSDAHWTDGDFDYSGVIDSADYFLLDRTFGILNNSLSPALLAQREAQFGDAYVNQLIAAVPEPTALGLATPLLVALAAGRRRRSRQAM